MFTVLLMDLLHHLCLALPLPAPFATLLGLTADSRPQAFRALLLSMAGAVTVGPLVFRLILDGCRRRTMRWRKRCDALLVADQCRVIRQDRCLPASSRPRDDFDLVLLLGEFVRLQATLWMASGPVAALLVLPVALLLHSRLATARRGRLTVSGSLSAVLAAATLPLPIGGHAVAARVSGRRAYLTSAAA